MNPRDDDLTARIDRLAGRIAALCGEWETAPDVLASWMPTWLDQRLDGMLRDFEALEALEREEADS